MELSAFHKNSPSNQGTKSSYQSVKPLGEALHLTSNDSGPRGQARSLESIVKAFKYLFCLGT